MIEGTISTALMRQCVEGLRTAGVDPARYAALAGLEPDNLANDLARVPASTGLVVCEELVLATRGTCLTHSLIERTPVGSLGVWDHLFTSGETILDGARDAARYLPLVTVPVSDSMEAVEDGSLVTLRFSTGPWEADVVAAAQEFALLLFLERARAAKRQPIVPVHVEFAHRAPRDHASLTRMLGTRSVDFGAETNSITFLAEDAATPLPGFRPGLPQVLRQHADMVLAATRPALDWRDRFRYTLMCAGTDDPPTLESTARQLALSPRSLQRRLQEAGTTFRQEVEAVREQRAMRLFQDTDLTLQSIAARVGYSDARALRRAVHRWHGQAPTTVRRELPGGLLRALAPEADVA